MPHPVASRSDVQPRDRRANPALLENDRHDAVCIVAVADDEETRVLLAGGASAKLTTTAATLTVPLYQQRTWAMMGLCGS